MKAIKLALKLLRHPNAKVLIEVAYPTHQTSSDVIVKHDKFRLRGKRTKVIISTREKEDGPISFKEEEEE